jgi:predicted DNA-binding transcriptional regulator YafY
MGRPKGSYRQAQRLIDLYDRMIRGQTLQAAQLATDLNLHVRSVQRDLAILHEVLEDRVERVEDPEHGLRLVGRSGRKWSVTRWQLMSVALGARMTKFMSGLTFDAALQPQIDQWRNDSPPGHRLDAANLASKLHVTELGHKQYRDNLGLLRNLNEMVDGLLLEQPIQIEYLSPKRRKEGAAAVHLVVMALCMTIHRGGVYFVVQSLTTTRGEAPRRILLALDRIQKITVDRKADALRYPADFRAAEFFASAFGIRTGHEKHAVRLRISADYAAAVEERTWHASQKMQRIKDGSLRLTMQLGDLSEVSDWILGMGEHVRVEGPSELIDLVRTRFARALRQYARD